MAWFLLFVAGLCEVAWAITLKYSEGFTRLWPTVGVFSGGIVSVVLLGLAVWTGIGVIGTAVLGIILFDEPRTALRLACMALIVVGIAGLRLLSPR
jgi:quaternary ammonium compound-resistance protein SugE